MYNNTRAPLRTRGNAGLDDVASTKKTENENNVQQYASSPSDAGYRRAGCGSGINSSMFSGRNVEECMELGWYKTCGCFGFIGDRGSCMEFG